jgi:hypothetical protein
MFCLLLWVIFALLDPDSDSEYGSGSTDLIEFGSNPDPDPKHSGAQGPRDHPCILCAAVFESKFDLQLHEESHEELLKRYKCHLCGAKFNKTKYLSKHIKSHSNYKPYKCDVCGKAFKSEYYVKTHRAAHTASEEGGGGAAAHSAGFLMFRQAVFLEDYLL